MNKQEAHARLNLLASGQAQMPISQINKALMATGDLNRWAPGAKVEQLEAKREWPYYAVTEAA